MSPGGLSMDFMGRGMLWGFARGVRKAADKPSVSTSSLVDMFANGSGTIVRLMFFVKGIRRSFAELLTFD